MRARLLVTLATALLLTGGSAGSPALTFDPSVTVTTTNAFTGDTQDWVGRASIKRRLSDNALVMVYRTGSAHDINDGALHIRFSDDDGAAWTEPDTTLAGDAVTGFPMNPSTVSAGQDAGEPWLMVAPNGDLLLHMWRVNYSDSLGGTYQSRSTDGGETWSTSQGPIQFAGLTATQNDKTFATDDDFVWDRTIYAGARVYTDADGDPSAIVLITSDDNGVSWTRLSTLVSTTDLSGHGAQEVGLEYVGNNTIIAMIRDNAHTHGYQMVSTDLGATWGTLTDVTSSVGILGRPRVYTRSHLRGLSGWWKDPVLFMTGFVHQTSGSSQDRRNAVWISPDRGTTWDGPHYVDTTAEDGGYGDLFWDGTNDRLGMVSYRGTLLAASLKQYNLTLTGLH